MSTAMTISRRLSELVSTPPFANLPVRLLFHLFSHVSRCDQSDEVQASTVLLTRKLIEAEESLSRNSMETHQE